MRFIAVILLFASQLAFASTDTALLTDSLPLYSKVYDDKRDPFADANAAITLANQTGRNVIIEVGGNWCTWCHKMDAFFEENPDVYQALHETFVLLKVNVSDSNENEKFMSAMPPVLGYPHMYVSTGKGKLVLSKDTADFLNSGSYSREQFMAFFNEWRQKNQVSGEM